ncbi:hypothetical protein [Kitasatospora aureofaciens]|uniref:hypothetical protein n=1 Tax=Kitasatospora aureofaciens TaxID=1894 RepID=UPI003F4C0E24
MTAHQRTRRKVLLLAGGVGITPMRALFETLPGGPGDIVLLYRANSPDELVLRHELEAIAVGRQAGLLVPRLSSGAVQALGEPLGELPDFGAFDTADVAPAGPAGPPLVGDTREDLRARTTAVRSVPSRLCRDVMGSSVPAVEGP